MTALTDELMRATLADNGWRPEGNRLVKRFPEGVATLRASMVSLPLAPSLYDYRKERAYVMVEPTDGDRNERRYQMLSELIWGIRSHGFYRTCHHPNKPLGVPQRVAQLDDGAVDPQPTTARTFSSYLEQSASSMQSMQRTLASQLYGSGEIAWGVSAQPEAPPQPAEPAFGRAEWILPNSRGGLVRIPTTSEIRTQEYAHRYGATFGSLPTPDQAPVFIDPRDPLRTARNADEERRVAAVQHQIAHLEGRARAAEEANRMEQELLRRRFYTNPRRADR